MMHRRRFLTAAAAAASAPAFIRNLRAASPNGKVRHASFGAQGMARADLDNLAESPHLEVVAVADVDTRNFASIRERWPDAKCYEDWRELLEKEGDRLDSVNVSTPDHMHGPIAAACLNLKKHVYGQKPLTHNLKECRHLTELARRQGMMSQMGIQASSEFGERYAVHIMQSGVIGKIREVHTFSDKEWGDMDPVPGRKDPVPAGFNWDLWLGPAEDRPFLEGYYHPANWRRRRDFGTGTLGDMGCHIFSSWMRGLSLTSPLKVKSTGPAPGPENWAIGGRVEYTFPGTEFTADREVSVIWYDGSARPPTAIADLVGGKLPGQGSVILGTDGTLLFGHGSRPMLYPADRFKDFRYPKLEPRNHWIEFVEACRGAGPKPSANFDYAGPLTEAVLLGCVASIFPDRELIWDGPGLTFPKDEDVRPFVTREYRKGWEIPGLNA